MLWSFIAVFFSGWLYVDASYRGPNWQRWVFKPITLLLMLLLALQAPMFSPVGYLIVAGLLATLVGDALTLLPKQRLLYAYGAFFLSHLLYSLFFASQLTFTLFWPLPMILVAIGLILMAMLWSRLEQLRMAVFAFIAVTLVMVWLAGENYFALPASGNLSMFLGSALLLLGSAIALISHYRFRIAGDRALFALCHFGGHFLIVRSLFF